jgi:tetratricopeptide (TPR) repeat protein
VDPEAFDLYLKGTQARYVQLPDANRQAQEYFEQAIARDSTYAPAYAGLASVRFFSDDPAEAQRLAVKAIELDAGLAEPHVVLGLVRQQYDWDWEGAEEAFRHAIRLDPGHAEAHHELSMHLMRLRRFDEALREAQHTLHLAPTSARFQHGLGEVLLFSGRYDEALVATERTLALDPNQVHAYWLRGIAYTQQGRYEEAIVAWRTSIRLWTLDSAHGNLGYVYAVAGRREEALTLLAALKARSGNGSDVERGTTYGIALIHTGLGEREQALEWLERAPRVWLAYVAIDPSLRSLHAEPRFHALLRKVGLAE